MRIQLAMTLLTACFLLPGKCLPDAAPVFISEIMFNPDGDENAREYVELINVSLESVSLEGFLLSDGEGLDTIVPLGNGTWIVRAGSFALIVDPDYIDSVEPYDDIPDDCPLFTVADKAIGSRGLSNSTAETVSLISPQGDTLSSVVYSLTCPAGHSWERINPEGGDAADNFASSTVADGSPGRKNTVEPPAKYPTLDESSIRFNHPAPGVGEPLDIYITYRNSGSEPLSDVEISLLILPDITLGTVRFTDPVQPGERSQDGLITIESISGGRSTFMAMITSPERGVSAGADTVSALLDVAIPSGTVLLSEVMAAPANGEPEWIEVINVGDTSVSLIGCRIRDSAGNVSQPVSEYVILEPGKFAVLSGKPFTTSLADETVLVVLDGFPALNNDGDSVTLIACTGAPVDSMAYEDTVTGYSYERIHDSTSGDPFDWDTCVDPSGSTPGEKNSLSYSGAKRESKPVMTIDPNPFSVTTEISCTLPFSVARVTLSVYDRRGRLVAQLRESEESGSEWSVIWDGASNGSKLPAGPYILNLEAFDKRSGKMVNAREIIVVASNL